MSKRDRIYTRYVFFHLESVIRHFTLGEDPDDPIQTTDDVYYGLLDDVLGMHQYFDDASLIAPCQREVKNAVVLAMRSSRGRSGGRSVRSSNRDAGLIDLVVGISNPNRLLAARDLIKDVGID